MDDAQFDVLTRAVVSGGTRRAMVRLLAGSVLGTVVARLGSDADAAARPERGRSRAKRQRPGYRGVTASHGRRHPSSAGAVRSEGKHKGKGKKGKHHHNPSPPPSPLPPGCANCNACQMCQDGACVPDPDLGGVPCEGSGPHCNYCLNGQCVATEDLPCDDGFCPHRGTCCPGEKYCPVHDSYPGYACVGQDDCCPGTKKCADGTCIPNDACCYDTPPPDCQGVCRLRRCVGGQEVCEDRQQGVFCRSSDGLEGTCCKGQCVRSEIVCPSYPWRKFNPATCACECTDGGTDIDGGSCCPAGYPYTEGYGTCSNGHGGFACPMGWSSCSCPIGSGRTLCCCPPGPL